MTKRQKIEEVASSLKHELKSLRKLSKDQATIDWRQGNLWGIIQKWSEYCIAQNLYNF